MIKNISTSTFNTFITTLRQEHKQGFMLVKFQHKAGFFCGTLSDEKEITTLYKDTLAKIDENAKELVLKKVAEIVEAAHGNVLSFVAEGEGYDVTPLTKEEREQIKEKSGVSDDAIPTRTLNGESVKDALSTNDLVDMLKPQPKKERRSRKAKSVEE